MANHKLTLKRMDKAQAEALRIDNLKWDVMRAIKANDNPDINAELKVERKRLRKALDVALAKVATLRDALLKDKE